MKVKSVMNSHSVISIDCSWTLMETERFFTNMRTDYLSINNDGEFIGLLSRDRFTSFVRDHELSKNEMSQLSVRVAMEAAYDFCDMDVSVRKALAVMKKQGLNYLAVRSLDKVVGVISFTSISTAVAYMEDDGSEVS